MNNIYEKIFDNLRVYKINNFLRFNTISDHLAIDCKMDRKQLHKKIKKYNGKLTPVYGNGLLYYRINFYNQSELDLFIKRILFPAYIFEKFK